jgi:prophage antirepressor-like protein
VAPETTAHRERAVFIVNAISECGTYKEVLKCKTREEAEGFKVALEADGWKVKIIEVGA